MEHTFDDVDDDLSIIQLAQVISNQWENDEKTKKANQNQIQPHIEFINNLFSLIKLNFFSTITDLCIVMQTSWNKYRDKIEFSHKSK